MPMNGLYESTTSSALHSTVQAAQHCTAQCRQLSTAQPTLRGTAQRAQLHSAAQLRTQLRLSGARHTPEHGQSICS